MADTTRPNILQLRLLETVFLKANGSPRNLKIKLFSKVGMPKNETFGFAWFWEGLDQYLDSMRLKQTPQRRVIVQALLEMNTHVDAEELHRKVVSEGHEIGLATVYRTLNLLTEAGLVEQQSFQDGRAVFEVSHPNSHHDHLVCTECGLVVEFEDPAIESLQNAIAAKFCMDLKSHRLDLFGSCKDRLSCLQRKKLKDQPK